MVDKLVYPTSIIDYVIEDIAQLSSKRINGREEIKVYYGSQINNFPHIGTIVSAMCAYSIASHLSEYFNLPSKVVFTGLENEGGTVKTVEGVKYSRMLCDDGVEGAGRFSRYVNSFRNMLAAFSDVSSVNTEIDFYQDLQAKPLARTTLLTMIENQEVLLPILNPLRDKLGVRYKCPECKYIDKHYKSLEMLEFEPNEKAVFRSKCFDHGYHIHTLTPENGEFFDVNGMVRNVIKEIVISHESEDNNTYPIIVKGGDWVPAAIMVSEALESMGFSFHRRPQRIFTPLILDWSGAKFSKSSSDEYQQTPKQFLSYNEFMSVYGKNGIKSLWEEISSWPKDTKKFYRNYTIEAFMKLLEG